MKTYTAEYLNGETITIEAKDLDAAYEIALLRTEDMKAVLLSVYEA